MSPRLSVGIDFDNTIVCYDAVFLAAAKDMELISNERKFSKQEIREYLLSSPGGEEDWKRLQGQVYGHWMHRSSLMPGVAWFLYWCRARDIKISIVSHKTEFGHYDDSKVRLRQVAMRWMIDQGFFDLNGFGLKVNNIYFESTRGNKVKRISELGLTCFIDDLVEVFQESDFPSSVEKILFSRVASSTDTHQSVLEMSSWSNIGRHLLGPETLDDLLHVARTIVSDSEITKCVELKGGKNSQVYKLTRKKSAPVVLKKYPIRSSDSRNRLRVEFDACTFLHQNDIRLVPEPKVIDKKANVGIYEYVSGSRILEPNERDIEQAVKFIFSLNTVKSLKGASELPRASEACLCGWELFRQIETRIKALREISNTFPELENHIVSIIEPLYERIRNWSQMHWPHGIDFRKNLSLEYQTLSLSDFGFHNALKEADGTVRFLDLEYFGWDDPVKLVSDFWWHPGMQLTAPIKNVWLNKTIMVFGQEQTFLNRLNALHPAYGVRWSLIVLNKFLDTSNNRDQIQLGTQLNKSVNLCNIVSDWLRHNRSITKRS